MAFEQSQCPEPCRLMGHMAVESLVAIMVTQRMGLQVTHWVSYVGLLQEGGSAQQKCFLSQFCRAQPKFRVLAGLALFQRLGGRIPLPVPGGDGHPWCPLACRRTTPSSASVFRWPPACVCLCPDVPLLYKDTSQIGFSTPISLGKGLA